MVVRSGDLPEFFSLGDVVKRLGVSPDRIRLDPRPGTVSFRDYLRATRNTERLYELVDGTLVEKTVGAPESRINNRLIGKIEAFVENNDLGFTLGADGGIRMLPSLVRMPDLPFISWQRRPVRTFPTDQVSNEIPDLTVEVISPRNTRRAMKRKLKEYFRAGVRLVWYVDPKKKIVQVYKAPNQMIELTERDRLDGGDVLPGFSLDLRWLFAAGPDAPSKKPSRNGH